MTEPIGVALIGAAHTTHAWSYARALTASSNAKIVGVHDPDPDLTRWIQHDFDVPFFDDAEALLGSPDVQAAIVCTPTASHRDAVELAASLGRHVLCEKPIATTIDDAAAIITACDAAAVQLHVAFVSRFLPMVNRARDAVRAGRLGELIGMVGGNRGRPPLPPSYPAWITDRAAAGGGALIDHSVHVVDVMRHVSGLEVGTVSAEADSLLWDCGVDDVAILSLRFAKVGASSHTDGPGDLGSPGHTDRRSGGAIGSIDPSWSVPADNPWDYDFYLRLLGTEGSLDITDGAESLNVVSTRDGGPRGLRMMSFGDDPDAAMIEAFVTSIQAGEHLDPSATGIDGLKALEVALAGYRSATTSTPIHLP